MDLNRGGVAVALGVLLPVALFLGLVLGPGLDATPPGPSDPSPERTRVGGADRMELRFVRDSGDVVRIVDVADGQTLRSLPLGEGGFLRGILRPLERERMRRGAELGAPYLLVRDAEGRLTLRDPLADLDVDVAAFGATSLALFEALLTGGPAPSIPPLMTSSTSMEDRP